MTSKISQIAILLVHLISLTSASNILGVFLTYSPSHAIIHMSIINALVEKGHNVTVISSMPLMDTNPGYRYIYLRQRKTMSTALNSIISDTTNRNVFLWAFGFYSAMQTISDEFKDFASNPDFMNFMKEDNKFDLMVLGYLYNDYLLGVAAQFNCPVVLSFVVEPFGQVSRLIGNPLLPAFVPLAPLMSSKSMNLWKRIDNFLLSVVDWIMSKKIDFESQKTYDKYFPRNMYPSYSEIKDRISLILCNSHFTESSVRPMVPGLIEIGGIHIKDKLDPLPKDIDEFLNNSHNGAIYFSLGSNVRNRHIGINVTNLIFNVLSNLPYNVIWKYDQTESLPVASNILFKKWIPQNEVLSHKNLKLFITHAGKGGLVESEYYGVPMVALPVMMDQFINAQKIESRGHGIKLDFQTMTEESFREAILNVVQNDKYRLAVQGFSKIYKDRPLTAKENAVYWIEYVIRHKGAPHLQSQLKKLNIVQENSIDVVLILILIVYLAFKAIKLIGKMVVFVFEKLLQWIEDKNKRKRE